MADEGRESLGQSLLDGFDHNRLIEATLELQLPASTLSGSTAVITHLLARANEYQLGFRPIQWTLTTDAQYEVYLMYISLLMDSGVSALVALTGSGVLLPTIIVQRCIVEWFTRAAFFDNHPSDVNQAFDHFAYTQYKDLKRDPRADPAQLEAARKFYEETKMRNPRLGERDIPLSKMMREVAGDPHGWIYALFIGFPSQIVHGLVGGVYRTISSEGGTIPANILRSPEEIAWDMLMTARCLMQFGDIMARRFQTSPAVDRAWLEGRLLALEQKYEMT